ncbi:FHA domain-containing protein [Lysobacter koreensis]|uniref:FHA domain-containing protein n=1 Tax=Lysobacter koreensis TaxID=266122 RepID=A0ABW2YN97_9GAMM
MTALKLRFPNREPGDLLLSPGVHAIGRDGAGRPRCTDHVDEALMQLCVDRRGIWLQLREGVRGLHVNGRPVRRMAMLRAGDAIFLDGVELLLLGDEPQAAPADDLPPPANDPRLVLRGVGGQHHGRCFSLDQPRLVGRAPECDIRINEPAFAERHARLVAHADGIVLRDLGSHDGSVVNGHRVQHALLRPGDQLVFDAHHRFVVESPRGAPAVATVEAVEAAGRDDETEAVAQKSAAAALPSSVRRLPWLLLAALLLAGALSLLLLYGAR